MTAPVQTMKADATNGKSKTPVPLRPFRIGAQPVDDRPYDVTRTLTAGTASLTPQYEVPSTGYLNEVEVLVEAVADNAGAAVTAFNEDGAFAVIDNITFTDTNNAEIITPITGWDLYVIDKYGGYNFSDDPKESPVYSATAGNGATGGSFNFLLRIPVELVPRDALGSLPNKSASTPFKVKVTVASLAAVYATAPSGDVDVRFRMSPVSYWEPTATDGSGNPVAPNPPGANTTQYWNKTDYVVNSGAISPQLTSSTGFPIRNLVFILRDPDGSRSVGETDFPDPFRMQLQSNIIIDRIKKAWQDRIARAYGYTGAVGDSAGSKDNGVYVEPYCKDFGPKPGWENRRGYLRTTDGMRLNVLGSVGGSGAHTLTVLTNYVGVAAGATLAQLTT